MSLVGLGRSAIYQMQAEGRFPKSVKLGARAVGWIADDVIAWIAERDGRDIASLGSVPEEPRRAKPHRRRTMPRPHPAPKSPNEFGRPSPIPYEKLEELERLRALEARVRQLVILRAEIDALLNPPARAKSRRSEKE